MPPAFSPVAELLGLQAERAPDAGAVLAPGEGAITYGELHARAGGLGRRLTSLGAGPGDTVGLLLDREPDFVTAAFGILAAGAACFPLAPSEPPARTAALLRAAGTRVVVARPGQGRALREVLPEAVVVDVDAGGAPAAGGPAPVPAGPHEPAFVFATSGSTGTPKAVVLPQHACVDQLPWVAETFELGPGDRHLFKSPVTFVSILRHLLWPLLTGGAVVVVPPGRERDLAWLAGLMAETGVTFTTFVPSVLRLVLEQPGAGAWSRLRHVVCGGELLSAALQRRFFERLPGAVLHNVYAMSEAPLVTHWRCAPGADRPAPIGRPVPGVVVRLVDDAGREAPAAPGATGELCVGGAIASGYLGASGAADRFGGPVVPGDPPVLFRSGDAVRHLGDGVLEHVGRIDDMVKVRGFRIEPREVEVVLGEHPAVAQAVVTARALEAGGDRRLVAYVVPAAGATLDVAGLRAHVAGRLPAYMVPAFFVALESLSLLPSGKPDLRALPAPAPEARPPAGQPGGPLEQTIVRIWAEVLGVAGVGPDSRWAELGGDSLRVVEMAMRLEAHLGRGLPFDVFIGASTPAELAGACRRLAPTGLGVGEGAG